MQLTTLRPPMYSISIDLGCHLPLAGANEEKSRDVWFLLHSLVGRRYGDRESGLATGDGRPMRCVRMEHQGDRSRHPAFTVASPLQSTAHPVRRSGIIPRSRGVKLCSVPRASRLV